ncbi:MAG: 23S rRNA (adenine(2503)-C(2))-methyltransferase RlmN [Candidatus Omnitrophica bacterium]|nr:23S rRNA (adenine(2503)-C(2))-methyltransferase RlmN [Candidatus Omnitrophota bacterium]
MNYNKWITELGAPVILRRQIQKIKPEKICLRGLSERELSRLSTQLGEQAYRGAQLARWIYGENVSCFKQINNLPQAFLNTLQERTELSNLEWVETGVSSDRSEKFLFRTQDNLYVETVWIRKNGRNTVCLSSQVGCKMNCSFCASSKGGFVRNLSASEITSQLALVQARVKEPVHNLVYMGMGEPLENVDAVMKSIEIVHSPWGYGIGSRRITVSTVGLVPGIEKFSEKTLRQVRLSISIHSPFDRTRSRIVPINRKYSLKTLMQTLVQHRAKFGREYTFEYTLLQGVNDSDKDAHELARLAKQTGSKVNLIAYNPIEDAEFERPELSRMRAFRRILDRHHVRNTLRISSGVDINAACGQLRLKKIESRNTKVDFRD